MSDERKHRSALLAALFLPTCMLVSACSLFTAHANFTPTMPYARSTRGPGEVQLIFLGSEPARSFMRVAQLNAGRSDYQGNEDLLNAIRQAAAGAGLDGVVDLQCGPGWSYAFQCTGTGFVYQR